MNEARGGHGRPAIRTPVYAVIVTAALLGVAAAAQTDSTAGKAVGDKSTPARQDKPAEPDAAAGKIVGDSTPAKPQESSTAAEQSSDETLLTPSMTQSAAERKRTAWQILQQAVSKDKRAQTRIQALAALGMLRCPEVERMIGNAMLDPDLDVRTAAVLAAGQTRDPNLTGSLRNLLDDKEPQVAFTAAMTLAKMGDRSGEDILMAVVDGDRSTQPGMLHGTEHKISRDLHNPGKLAKLGAMQGAAMLLGPFGFGITAFEFMRQSGGDSARAAAIEQIAQEKTEPIHRELMDALKDKDPGVRAAAAKALTDYHDQPTQDAIYTVLLDPRIPRDLPQLLPTFAQPEFPARWALLHASHANRSRCVADRPQSDGRSARLAGEPRIATVNTSLFELFKIGIGPSSSHTVGPMRAALRFVRELDSTGALDRTARITIDLYGSLALTGKGHGTDRAVMLGLMGEAPDTVDPATIEDKLAAIGHSGKLRLGGKREIDFQEPNDLRFRKDQMYPTAGVSTHPNGVRFSALDASGATVAEEVFYSVGGGFIVTEAERTAGSAGDTNRTVPYPYRSAEQLLELGRQHGMTIADIVLANECALMESPGVPILRPTSTGSTTRQRVESAVLELWRAMQACTERGMEIEGVLPGGLNVRRRAPRLARRLRGEEPNPRKDPLNAMDWVTMWAMAVNEENAAGGRVVTAPTNGAAGVIPAIAQYYLKFVAEDLTAEQKRAGLLRYFLAAAAIGILYKENASISGAEVGCQGEVGVACSMAAAGLTAAQDGTNEQVEHAAEIAMEHNLGMTCDPIGGLVQIPCIERNGMGAVKAINASRLAIYETEGHKLSLDQIIDTMYRTGMDMQSRYKETSLAGLALNIIEC